MPKALKIPSFPFIILQVIITSVYVVGDKNIINIIVIGTVTLKTLYVILNVDILSCLNLLYIVLL